MSQRLLPAVTRRRPLTSCAWAQRRAPAPCGPSSAELPAPCGRPRWPCGRGSRSREPASCTPGCEGVGASQRRSAGQDTQLCASTAQQAANMEAANRLLLPHGAAADGRPGRAGGTAPLLPPLLLPMLQCPASSLLALQLPHAVKCSLLLQRAGCHPCMLRRPQWGVRAVRLLRRFAMWRSAAAPAMAMTCSCAAHGRDHAGVPPTQLAHRASASTAAHKHCCPGMRIHTQACHQPMGSRRVRTGGCRGACSPGPSCCCTPPAGRCGCAPAAAPRPAPSLRQQAAGRQRGQRGMRGGRGSGGARRSPASHPAAAPPSHRRGVTHVQTRRTGPSGPPLAPGRSFGAARGGCC